VNFFSNIQIRAILIISIIIGIIFLISRILLKYFFKNEKEIIKQDLIKYFDAKVNLNGEYEIRLKERKIIVEYDWEDSVKGASEYIVSYIDISDLNKDKQDELSKRYGIVQRRGKTFLQIYSRWGYRGERFRERNNEIIELLFA